MNKLALTSQQQEAKVQKQNIFVKYFLLNSCENKKLTTNGSCNCTSGGSFGTGKALVRLSELSDCSNGAGLTLISIFNIPVIALCV